MSASAELQKLIYDRLVADTSVHDAVADRIYDGVPEGVTFPFVSFGPSDVIEDDAECITGRVETIQIDCWSRYQGGFKEVKDVADAVKGALHLYDGALTVNALVEMRVVSMRFLRDPDGLTSHGVVTLQAIVEEIGEEDQELSISFETPVPVATVTGHTRNFDGDPNDLLIYVGSTKYVRNAAGILVPGTTLRTDHDAGGDPLGLLVEGERTNLLTYSEQFDNAAWTPTLVTVTVNQAVAPDGASTADLVVPDASIGKHYFQHSVSQLPGVDTARTIYVKSAGYRYFGIGRAVDDGSRPIIFDLQTGTIVQAALVDPLTGSIEDAGNGWYWIVTQYAGSLAGTMNPRYYAFTDSVSFPFANSGTDAAGDGVSGFYVWGAGLEAGSGAGSYIKTSDAAVTRDADDIQLALSDFPWNGGDGVLTLNGSPVDPILSGSDLDIAATVLAAGETHLRTLTWTPS